MTKYRKYNDGYKDFLQYEISHSFLGIKWTTWNYIKAPYYSEILGRSDSTGSDIYVCSYNISFKQFIFAYPNIEDYFPYYKAKQKELEDAVFAKKKAQRDKIGKTELLN